MIVRDGLRRMLAEQEDVFYYLTLMNENYAHPAMPEGARGGHPARDVPAARGRAGRGRAAGAAARLGHDPARGARRGRRCCATTSASRPTSGASRASPSCAATGWRSSAGTACIPTRSRGAPASRRPLAGRDGPVVAATDYMRAFADQIRPWVPAPYRVLGTDGFGRSDYRKALRALLRGRPPPRRAGGADGAGRRGRGRRRGARARRSSSYGIDPERPAPWRV